MAGPEVEQRLAAILAADVAGYTRLMADDEPATIATITEYRTIFRTHIEANGGRVVDMAGDSILAVFTSAAGAVKAAVEAQGEVAGRNQALPEARRMRFRVGDIREADDGTVYGDGVNIAARLEGLAEPGGVMISETVHLQVRRNPDLGFADAGAHEVKNVAEPVRAYRVLAEGETTPKPRTALRSPKALAAVVVAVVALAGIAIWQLTATPEPAQIAEAPEDPVLAMPTGPTIAVLPFDNLGGDTDQDYFAKGLTRDIIIALNRFQDIRVIGGSMTERFQGTSADMAAIKASLGTDYVLEGSVRRSGDSLRITVELIDAQENSHIWGESFDRSLSAESIFDVQDTITAQVVSVLAGHSGVIARQMIADAAGNRTQDLGAYECVLLAYAYDRLLSKRNYRRARECLEGAVRRDPDYAEALVALSYIYADGYLIGYTGEEETIDFLGEAFRLASRAVELAPASADARRGLAMAYFYRGELPEFRDHAERAMAINPNDPTILGQLGTFIGFSGDYARAGPLLRKAFALNPELPYWYKFTFAGEHYMAREWEAGRTLMEALDTTDDNPHTHIWHLLFLGELGMRDRASAVIQRLETITPDFSIEHFRADWAGWNVPPTMIEACVASLRKAGVRETVPEPSRPIIAVLPFDNLGGDPEQEYFADGITEDIIIKLTQFREFGIVAPTTAFEYRGNAENAGDELGADYVLGGSVRRDGESIRVSARLIATADGTHVWAKAYDRPLDTGGIFAVQDEIASDVAGTIGDKYGVVVQAGIESLGAATDSLSSYECVLRTKHYVLNFSEPLYQAARSCLDRVTEADPDYAEAWAARAEVYVDGATTWGSSLSDLDDAKAFAKRAVSLAPGNQYAHWALAYAYLTMGERERFVASAEKAIALNPNNASVVGGLGAHLAASGNWERGVGLVNQAISLNPNYPPWINYALVANFVRRGDYESALEKAQDWIERNPDWHWPHAVMIMVLGLLDRPADAGTYIESLHALSPDFESTGLSELSFFIADEDIIGRYIDGWHKAGLDVVSEP